MRGVHAWCFMSWCIGDPAALLGCSLPSLTASPPPAFVQQQQHHHHQQQQQHTMQVLMLVRVVPAEELLRGPRAVLPLWRLW
jgi:hypothetical protein